MVTRKEIAAWYKINPATLNKRLDAIGICRGQRISPKELKIIFEELGKPLEDSEFDFTKQKG
ncbi:MAG: hypothetical protein JEY96_00795 [Bacteroidales bacterium]|nr:hypothetical protein [Bacteroidales bacterium]